MPQVEAKIQLRVAGREVTLTMDLPVEPVPASALLPIYRGMAGMLIGIGIDQAKGKGRSVSCRTGCAACCRQLVPITRMEAQRLATVVAELPEASRERIVASFAEALARLAQAGLLDRLRDPGEYATAKRKTALALDYFQLYLDCPFLDQETCAVYDDRPMGCREYLVTSPAEHCRYPSRETIRMVPLPGSAASAVARTETSFQGAELPPDELAVVPLPLALEWAAAHTLNETVRPAQAILQQFFAHLTR